MTHLSFEWDERKQAANLFKHGVSFLTAAEVFDNPIVDMIDDSDDYGELRMVAIGRLELQIYRVVYTWRGPHKIRIISARKASKHERKIYYRDIYNG